MQLCQNGRRIANPRHTRKHHARHATHQRSSSARRVSRVESSRNSYRATDQLPGSERQPGYGGAAGTNAAGAGEPNEGAHVHLKRRTGRREVAWPCGGEIGYGTGFDLTARSGEAGWMVLSKAE
jgi:hypothetical protein